VPPTNHVILPDGATAFVEPVTDAVKVMVPPRVGVPEEETAIVGVAAATVVVEVEAEGDTA
jgi:hypothetical protein